MTKKEAIEKIKLAIAEVEWEYPIDYAAAFDAAIDSLEKSEKYRWHDLMKDHNDLPESKFEYEQEGEEGEEWEAREIVKHEISDDVLVMLKNGEMFVGSYFSVFSENTGIYKDETDFFDGFRLDFNGTNKEFDSYKVLAWKYIEPFNDEECAD